MSRIIAKVLALVGFALVLGLSQAQAQQKPNVLILWGDDIGYWNVSAYNQGMMGYKTPNIDRIAKEGANFTDWYGQQSCTAGRACFLTGQVGFRTGMVVPPMMLHPTCHGRQLCKIRRPTCEDSLLEQKKTL